MADKASAAAGRRELFGNSPTSVVRFMGSKGYNFKQARYVLDKKGLKDIADATVRTQIQQGKSGVKDPPEIKKADQAEIKALAAAAPQEKKAPAAKAAKSGAKKPAAKAKAKPKAHEEEEGEEEGSGAGGEEE